MDGNAAAANALFQKYLNGELSDELLRISRSWVQEEQACSPNRWEEADKIGVADPQASERLTPLRPVERRRYDVLENGVIIGRIFKVPIAPAERPWMWASGHNGEIRCAAQPADARGRDGGLRPVPYFLGWSEYVESYRRLTAAHSAGAIGRYQINASLLS
jgi:hypothetical protein